MSEDEQTIKYLRQQIEERDERIAELEAIVAKYRAAEPIPNPAPDACVEGGI